MRKSVSAHKDSCMTTFTLSYLSSLCATQPQPLPTNIKHVRPEHSISVFPLFCFVEESFPWHMYPQVQWYVGIEVNFLVLWSIF